MNTESCQPGRVVTPPTAVNPSTSANVFRNGRANVAELSQLRPVFVPCHHLKIKPNRIPMSAAMPKRP